MIGDPWHRRSSEANRTASSSPSIALVAALMMIILALIGAATWLVNLERTLPDARSPRDPGSSTILSGHALMLPGHHEINEVDAQVEGDWLVQVIGESDWLATEEEGGQLRAAFYGTEIYLLARIGPEAGRAYITVNERPVEHLAMDEGGSYVNLWAGQASDVPILLGGGFAHGEHQVGVIAAGDGEVAISGFEVVAETPFPWAFVLAYSGIAGGLFLALRELLYLLSRQSDGLLVIPNRQRADSSDQ